MLGEFREFIQRGNVVDMAVGVIIGGATARAERGREAAQRDPRSPEEGVIETILHGGRVGRPRREGGAS